MFRDHKKKKDFLHTQNIFSLNRDTNKHTHINTGFIYNNSAIWMIGIIMVECQFSQYFFSVQRLKLFWSWNLISYRYKLKLMSYRYISRLSCRIFVLYFLVSFCYWLLVVFSMFFHCILTSDFQSTTPASPVLVPGAFNLGRPLLIGA